MIAPAPAAIANALSSMADDVRAQSPAHLQLIADQDTRAESDEAPESTADPIVAGVHSGVLIVAKAGYTNHVANTSLTLTLERDRDSDLVELTVTHRDAGVRRTVELLIPAELAAALPAIARHLLERASTQRLLAADEAWRDGHDEWLSEPASGDAVLR